MKFLRIFLISGISAGLVAGVFAYFVTRELISSLGSGLIPGLIFGASVSALTVLYTKYTPYSGGSFLFLSILAIILGILLSFAYIFIEISFPYGGWKLFEAPPETPIEFVGDIHTEISEDLLIVKSDKENLFLYSCVSNRVDCGWKRIDEFSEEALSEGRCFSPLPEYIHPLYPGKVLAKKILDGCGADSAIQYQYILLEDGSIWVWEKHISGMYIALLHELWLWIGPAIALIGTTSTLLNKEPYWRSKKSDQRQPNIRCSGLACRPATELYR